MIQLVYRHAKERNERLEAEAFQQLKETEVFNTLPPDWDRIITQQERIEQALGLPDSRKTLREATDALLHFALAWIIQHGTTQQEVLFRKVLDISLTYSHEGFLEVCMNIPEENPIPAFIQDLAAFFGQQQQASEEALRQNYALHESHLVFLEHALAHIQADQLEEAERDLLCFYSEEQQRLRDQARLQSILGREEPSPHRERHEALLRQLSEATRANKG
jgi:hypothetical protein